MVNLKKKPRRNRQTNGGSFAQRTREPANSQEQREAVTEDFRTTLLAYVQNILLPSQGLDAQNMRRVLGISGPDSLGDFLKSQVKNYADRTPETETEIENNSQHGEILKPSVKQSTRLQKYEQNVDLGTQENVTRK